MFHRWIRLLPLFVLCLVLAGAPGQLRAEEPQAGAPPTEPAPSFTVHAQLVLVDAAVVWRKTGKPVAGLSAADFTLAEEGLPVAITSCSTESLPLSLVLLLDLTDTVHPVLQHLASGAAEVLRQLRPQDEVAVMSFSSRARLEQRFTRDRMAALEGLDAASASYDRHEPTFLFEDLWAAVEQSEATRLPQARRVQVWLTDGSANDQDTQRGLARHAPARLHTEAEATAALLHSGVVLSVLLERSDLHGNGRFGDAERLANVTGGLVVPVTEGNAADRFGALLDTLRARYTLGYKPAANRPAGSLVRLHLSLSPAFWAAHPDVQPKDVEVHARSSYVQ